MVDFVRPPVRREVLMALLGEEVRDLRDTHGEGPSKEELTECVATIVDALRSPRRRRVDELATAE